MPNKPFTTKQAFDSSTVRTMLGIVEKFVQKIETDFTKFTNAELEGIKNMVLAYGRQEFQKLFDNFMEIELMGRRGIPSTLAPSIFSTTRERYTNNWVQAVNKGFATAADSARGLQQKIQRELLAEIKRENERQRVLAIRKGAADPVPKVPGWWSLLLRIFGLQRATKTKTRRVNLGLVSYLTMLLRTMPRNMERDLMQYTIRYFETEQLFFVTGGVVHNSASTCRFAAGRVLTKEALDFVTESSALKVHLFHPNCRHRIVPPPKNYDGPITDVKDLPSVQNGHFQGFHK